METQAVEISLSRLYHRDLASRRAVLINNSDLIFFQILQITISSEVTSPLIAKKALNLTKERNEGVKDCFPAMPGPHRIWQPGLGWRQNPCTKASAFLAGSGKFPFPKCWTNSKAFASRVDLVISEEEEDGLCPEMNQP